MLGRNDDTNQEENPPKAEGSTVVDMLVAQQGEIAKN